MVFPVRPCASCAALGKPLSPLSSCFGCDTELSRRNVGGKWQCMESVSRAVSMRDAPAAAGLVPGELILIGFNRDF